MNVLCQTIAKLLQENPTFYYKARFYHLTDEDTPLHAVKHFLQQQINEIVPRPARKEGTASDA